MPTLHELQCRFRDALVNNNASEVESHIRFDGISATTRLGIYRNNVFTNLREALRTIFPVINKLVGETFFNYAADEFIYRFPSTAGDLNQFGEQFAEFWAEFAPAAELVYLPDMARLEWLAHKTYHAADITPFDVQSLAALSPNTYSELQFRLNPACALFESTYPVHQIWQANQPGCREQEVINLDSGGVQLLIQRRGSLIELQSLEFGEWVFLTALSAGNDFATACSKTLHVNPNFDLTHFLSELVLNSTLVDFSLRNQTHD